MKVKKPVKKAQNGDTTKSKLPSSKVAMKTVDDRFVDLERERVKGPSTKIDTTARGKAIREGYFKEDPKSGDLIRTEKYFADRKAGKKLAFNKNGGTTKAKFGAKMLKKGVIKKAVKSTKKK